MHELMFQAGVKGMSERSELIPCRIYNMNMLDNLMPLSSAPCISLSIMVLNLITLLLFRNNLIHCHHW